MKNIIAILIMVSLSACSIFQSAEKDVKRVNSNDSSDEVYVFDEVSENETEVKVVKKVEKTSDKVKSENINNNTAMDVFDETVENNENQIRSAVNKFYLQLGAFSTLKRAEIFVNDNSSQLNFTLSIIYAPKTELYTVRSSAYNTKPQVEKIRDDFWKKNLYKDAFIVTE